jgi:hypothetical protein
MKPYEIWDYLDKRFGIEPDDSYHQSCLAKSIINQEQHNKLEELFDKNWGWYGDENLGGKDINSGILYLNLIYKLICDYDNKR